ncbi:hypothetical protein TREMEDRAFT_40715 [Tremella mesenterica DSM 1558]|uniref:uncharacterized protein n=1 Tax=Tremella mesenterica (strain ATCC 24925 / CBS 8224 / DSM 1558 / NBRC 9311 / NRRL Y-6157 / RJB 2259-6 / UBC 559-6) TaxID=578456 RepID=UPI0003F49435|nr:uncharacterized protein TREMEDRAFT_40715 [Tremella mesenterica DSM 1558]EIW67151.1 hypothetical protein TREMEDRAFT_40715 [Tremella mesenterica DSM 1558]
MDQLGYMYSLRVALLHHHLSRPPPPRTNTMYSNGSTAPSPSPGLNSPAFLSSPPILRTPDPQNSPKRTTTPPTVRRKSFGISLKRSDPDALKLPKEFLIDFWNTLSEEQGDTAWTNGVQTLLGLVTKGSKTPSGMNLREIPTLLDAFTNSLPPQTLGTAPTHAQQTHFLQLLYNSLPRSSHFSPLARNQSEKDKDLLFRLRAEVQSFMLPASPDPDATTTRTPKYLGDTQKRQSSQNEIKRKPSPIWVEDADGEMVEAVGMVWNVPKDVLERDAMNIRRSGSLESLYLTDLKRTMSALTGQSQQTLPPSQRTRQLALSQSLSNLLKDFPDLATPSSPVDYAFSGGELFFTPPSKGQVFVKLIQRAGEAGLGVKTRDLVEKCRDIWGIESRREKERELEAVIARWGNSIDTRDEIETGHLVEENLRDLSALLNPSEPLPPPIVKLYGDLVALLSSAISNIFPTSSVPPPPPNPSVLPILRAAPDLLQRSSAYKTLQDLADEIKGQAVGEYVVIMSQFGLGETNIGISANGKDQQVEAFEQVADWMETEISGVRKTWRDGLGPMLNPAGLILSKQLPLFLAELQILDKPRGAASDVFTLYETTGRLLSHWEDLCPEQEHAFELDAFFEPHVEAWLRDTQDNNTHEWVSRAVGMDSNKHSQSVIDLFDFIRESAQVILHDLPLGEYKRAVYLIDLSRTVSIAVSQYASTVLALFNADMNPKLSTPTAELQNKLDKIGGKAGNWLAKGQQAVKSLERKKVDGFMVPPVACVKLTDMGAARISLDDLSFAMEAEETARIINLKPKPSSQTVRHVFTVNLMRGENLSGKGNKAPDAFVIINDKESGERYLKSRTMLGAEDPRWEQSFEVSVGSYKTLELLCYDRQLVGKHDLIGSSTFKLDSRAFVVPTRDILVPLGRGMVHLRVSMEGGERHDIAYHLGVASRALERAADDMVRELVDKMSEFVKSQLSLVTLHGLTKPKDKKKVKQTLTQEDIDGSLLPLFDYLNDNFSVFSVTLTPTTRIRVMLALWRRVIDILISLLVPPLSDRPTNREPVTGQETDIIFKWLQTLKAFFNASEHGTEHGVPLQQLQSGVYKDIVTLGQYLDLPTPALREKCQAAVKAACRPRGTMSALSLDAGGDDGDRMAEVLLRIARTREGTGEFLSTQIQTLTRARVERQAAEI